MKKWVCKVCGYVYEGETLPEDFICPLCKHGAAVLLQLCETLEKIHEHWPDALAEDGYFAAVSKSAFSFFTTSSNKPASITLT